MRRALVLLAAAAVGLSPLFSPLFVTPALAQTATPTPGPTGSATANSAQATLNALPTYDALGGSATMTPFPTVAWPTLTPANLAPIPWAGVGDVEMTPGGPFDPPGLPDLTSPDIPGVDTPNGFQGINDANIAGFMVYLIDVAINFFRWFAVNFPKFVVASRWFVIIMLVLYGIFWVWKGRRFVPPDAERDANPRRFFFRSFRMGGRYYYYNRGSRKPDDSDKPRQEKLL